MGEFFTRQNVARVAPLLVALQGCLMFSLADDAVAGSYLSPYDHVRPPGLINDPNNPCTVNYMPLASEKAKRLLAAENKRKTATSSKSTKNGSSIKFSRVVDLTHDLSGDIPNFHPDPKAYEYTQVYTVKKDGYANGRFSMPEHYGTHLDAPSHFRDGAKSIDQIEAKDLVLPCVVIDVREEAKQNPDYRLSVDKIKEFEKSVKIPEKCAVLLLTGWDKRWTQPEAYRNTDAAGKMHFPGFSCEAAEYLVKEHKVTGIGTDTLSLDAGDSSDYCVHVDDLPQMSFFAENLASLEELPTQGALLICGPLRIKNGTGSPARVFALIP